MPVSPDEAYRFRRDVLKGLSRVVDARDVAGFAALLPTCGNGVITGAEEIRRLSFSKALPEFGPVF